ncbi:MAG TPA: 16S rRNA (cytidine(1402)-2'-O)-methyltransferase [Dissulfurispiraceae bacterium]|nr:16S rRNA (cytidine(1402)-2'-O)-methyltransferase [Dissulfurispiraceae bacterium]
MSGKLYIVSTPLGNLEDITLRALRVLREVDLVAAEDTRHSLKLLNHYAITKPLISYWSEKEKVRAEEILDRLRSGLSVALISDAGTPGISDPGSVLIRRAIEEDLEIIVIPGPSAHTAALSVSGLPTEEFCFLGFLPPKTGQRKKRLTELKHESRTIIFYEAPHRVLQLLSDAREILGDRRIALAKEISKIHEEVLRGPISTVLAALQSRMIAGEYVLVVEGFHKQAAGLEEALSEVSALMKKGLGRKEAVRTVADTYGVSKKELYDKSLALNTT